MAETPLTPKQRIYCEHRATGRSVNDSAAAAGVAPDTATKWNRLPEIDAEIERIQSPIRNRVRQRFRAHAERAAERIIECIEPGYNIGNTADTNIKAAALVLKFAEMEPATKTQIGGDPDNPAPLVVERVIFKGE